MAPDPIEELRDDLTPEQRAAIDARRLRRVLVVVIVFLLVLMAAVGYLFLGALRPVMQPLQTTETGATWIRSLYGYGPTESEQLHEPTDVAIGSNGDIYVSEPQRARIMIFRPDGTFSRLIQGDREAPHGTVRRPGGLAVSEDGELFVVDWNRKIVVFGPDGQYRREWDLGAAGGRIHVYQDQVHVSLRDGIVQYTTDGEQVGLIRPGRGRAPGQLDAGAGIYFDGERYFIADLMNGRVQAFDRDGSLLWAVPESRDATSVPLPTGGVEGANPPENPPYELPQDLTLDGSGRVVTVDAFRFAIIVADAETGAPIASYGEAGSREGELFYPTGIAYDPVRDWFAIADTRNDRIQIVRIAGSGGGGTVARTLASPWRYCAIPLVVLVLSLVAVALSRRRSRRA